MTDTIPPIYRVQIDILTRRIEYFTQLLGISKNLVDQAGISAQRNNAVDRLSILILLGDKAKLWHMISFAAVGGSGTVSMEACKLPYDNSVRGRYARGSLQEIRERTQHASIDPQIASKIENRVQQILGGRTESTCAVTEGLTEDQLANLGFKDAQQPIVTSHIAPQSPVSDRRTWRNGRPISTDAHTSDTHRRGPALDRHPS
jgi:hypothetical protein